MKIVKVWRLNQIVLLLFLLLSSDWRREKMMCWTLLLLILTSCVCAATFVVNVTQSSYQAEENHNITLEWTFTTRPDSSWRSLFIFCYKLINHKASELYEVHDGVELPESQHEQFAGRVQSDKDVLREGQIRLHVSRLKTEDSGLYVCEVSTKHGSSSASCELSVTAAGELTHSETPALIPQSWSLEEIELYVGVGGCIATVVIGCVVYYFVAKGGQTKAKRQSLICTEFKGLRESAHPSSYPFSSYLSGTELWGQQYSNLACFLPAHLGNPKVFPGQPRACPESSLGSHPGGESTHQG